MNSVHKTSGHVCSYVKTFFKNLFNRFLPENSYSQKWWKSQGQYFVKIGKPYFYLDRTLLVEEPCRYYKVSSGTSLPLTSDKWNSTYGKWANCNASNI